MPQIQLVYCWAERMRVFFPGFFPEICCRILQSTISLQKPDFHFSHAHTHQHYFISTLCSCHCKIPGSSFSCQAHLTERTKCHGFSLDKPSFCCPHSLPFFWIELTHISAFLSTGMCRENLRIQRDGNFKASTNSVVVLYRNNLDKLESYRLLRSHPFSFCCSVVKNVVPSTFTCASTVHRKRKAGEERRGRKKKTRCMLSKTFLTPLNFLPSAFSFYISLA